MPSSMKNKEPFVLPDATMTHAINQASSCNKNVLCCLQKGLQHQLTTTYNFGLLSQPAQQQCFTIMFYNMFYNNVLN